MLNDSSKELMTPNSSKKAKKAFMEASMIGSDSSTGSPMSNEKKAMMEASVVGANLVVQLIKNSVF